MSLSGSTVGPVKQHEKTAILEHEGIEFWIQTELVFNSICCGVET